MDFDWVLIGIGCVGLVAAVVQWMRGGFVDQATCGSVDAADVSGEVRG